MLKLMMVIPKNLLLLLMILHLLPLRCLLGYSFNHKKPETSQRGVEGWRSSAEDFVR
jgi:hypothetical protein